MSHLEVNSRLRIPLSELAISFARSGGPGGQNVNKVATKVMLRWPVRTSPSLPEDVRERFTAKYRRRITTDGDLVLTSQRYRDQRRNLDDCLEKLAQMIREVAQPPRRRKPTRRTAGSVERRLQQKRARSEKKQRRRGTSEE